MRWLRRTTARLVLLAGVALVVPTGGVHPTTISLTTIGTAKAVDAGADTLWVLALGAEASGGADVEEALTDAIQLIGVEPGTGRAVAIGLPRDLYVDLPGDPGRLNTALRDHGPEEVARQVAQLTGIEPDVVLVTGFDGFLTMMGTLGDVEVDSPLERFTTEEGGVVVQRGTNTFDAEQALYYARTRTSLPGQSDFERVANHQRLLLAALERLEAAEDEEGFMESVALSALAGLETDMTPGEVYRLVQSLTTIEPRRTAACIIGGTFETIDDAAVVVPDRDQARAVGRDALDDMRLQGGCRDGS
jgi:LCP family protein required for cell wall assembly